MQLEESSSLSSDYTTKLQSLKQYGTGTKTDIGKWKRIKSPKINLHIYDQLIYDKKQEYTMEKGMSSIRGAGKSEQLHVKE